MAKLSTQEHGVFHLGVGQRLVLKEDWMSSCVLNLLRQALALSFPSPVSGLWVRAETCCAVRHNHLPEAYCCKSHFSRR